MLCAPVKPSVGLSPQEFAEEAYQAFLGGADIVKDDELLGDVGYSPFAERVTLAQRAAERAEQVTGERKLYAANLICDADSLPSLLKRGEHLGLKGIMLSPILNGLSQLRLIRSSTDMIILCHNVPASSNSQKVC